MNSRPQFGESAAYSANNFCYRHSDQPSFVLCQRCGNTICPNCQVQQPVGVLCPNCVKQLRPSKTQQMRRASRVGYRRFLGADTPITYGLIAVSVLVWLLQLVIPDLTSKLWYAPVNTTVYAFEPWRIFTAMFAHNPGSVFHILFNMFTLYFFGRQLEQLLGKICYLALYLFSGIGGSLAVAGYTLLQPVTVLTPVVGASGAVFGLIAATLVIYRRLDISARSLIFMLGINIFIGFLPGFNISWQAHLGGMILGAAVMSLFWAFRVWIRPLAAVIIICSVSGILLLLFWLFQNAFIIGG